MADLLDEFDAEYSGKSPDLLDEFDAIYGEAKPKEERGILSRLFGKPDREEVAPSAQEQERQLREERIRNRGLESGVPTRTALDRLNSIAADAGSLVAPVAPNTLTREERDAQLQAELERNARNRSKDNIPAMPDVRSLFRKPSREARPLTQEQQEAQLKAERERNARNLGQREQASQASQAPGPTREDVAAMRERQRQEALARMTPQRPAILDDLPSISGPLFGKPERENKPLTAFDQDIQRQEALDRMSPRQGEYPTLRATGDFVKDTAVGTMSGITSLSKLVSVPLDLSLTGEAFGPMTQAIDEYAEAVRGQHTDSFKEKEEARKARVNAAGAAAVAAFGGSSSARNSIVEQIGRAVATAVEIAKDPAALASTLAEQLGMFAAMARAGKAAGGISAFMAEKAPALLGTAPGRFAIANAATAAVIGTGGVLQGVDIGSETKARLMELPPDLWRAVPGFKELEDNIGYDAAVSKMADDKAVSAAIRAGVLSVAVNSMIPAAGEFERAVASRFAGAVARKVEHGRMRAAFNEAFLSEAPEEVGGQVFGNVAVKSVDPRQSLLEGTGEAAGQAVVAAAPLAGATHRPGAARSATSADGGRADLSDRAVTLVTFSDPNGPAAQAGITPVSVPLPSGPAAPQAGQTPAVATGDREEQAFAGVEVNELTPEEADALLRDDAAAPSEQPTQAQGPAEQPRTRATDPMEDLGDEDMPVEDGAVTPGETPDFTGAMERLRQRRVEEGQGEAPMEPALAPKRGPQKRPAAAAEQAEEPAQQAQATQVPPRPDQAAGEAATRLAEASPAETEGGSEPAVAERWAGRGAAGFSTLGSANSALRAQQRKRPDLDWSVAERGDGRFELEGRQRNEAVTEDPASKVAAPVWKPSEAERIEIAAAVQAEVNAKSRGASEFTVTQARPDQITEAGREAERVASAFGLPVVFVTATDARGRGKMHGAKTTFNGREVVLLNVDSPKAPLAITAHELTHALPEHLKGPVLQAVREVLPPEFRTKARANAAAYKGLSDNKADEELAAILMEDVSKDSGFWAKVFSRLPDGAVRQLFEAISAKLSSVFGAGGVSVVGHKLSLADAQKIRAAVGDAFAKWAEERAGSNAAQRHAKGDTARETQRVTEAVPDPLASETFLSDMPDTADSIDVAAPMSAKRASIKGKGRRKAAPRVMPLFVRAEKPFDPDNASDLKAVIDRVIEDGNSGWTRAQLEDRLTGKLNNWEATESKPVQDAIKALGHDGFYIREAGVKNLAVYDPKQVKSAIGNRGTFDPNDSDISLSIEDDFAKEKQSFGRKFLAGLEKTGRIAKGLRPSDFLTKSVKTEAGKELVTDAFDDQFPAINAARRAGLDDPIARDFVFELESLSGRIVDRTDKADAALVAPLQKALGEASKRLRMTVPAMVDAFGLYRLAMHAQERNATLRERGSKKVSPSGMSDQEARTWLKFFKSQPPLLAEMRKLDPLLKAIQEETDRILMDAGLLTQEEIDARADWKWYVNLAGDPTLGEDGSDAFVSASWNDDTLKGAKGRDSLSVNPLVNTLNALQAAINNAEYATVKAALYAFAKAHPKALGAEVKGLGAQPMYDANGNLVYFKPTEDKFNPNAVVYRQGKHQWVIKFADRAIADAIKRPPRKAALRPLRIATRMLAQMLTRFSPTFPMVNVIRDIQQQLTLMLGDTITDANGNKVSSAVIAAKMASRYHRTFSAALKEAFGKAPTGKYSAAAKELKRLGGVSGFSRLFNDAEALKDFVREAEKASGQNTKAKVWDGFIDFIDNVNETFELTGRVAAFSTLVELGVDPKAAANITKNLLNFDKAGTMTRDGWMGAAYMFIRPAMTDFRRNMQLLKTPKGAAMIMLGTMLSAAAYAMLREASGDDDDDPESKKLDKHSASLRRNYIILPFGGDTPVRIPVGYGPPRIMWGLGVSLVDAIANKHMTQPEVAEGIVRSFTSAVSPFNFSDVSPTESPLDWAALSFTPSVLQPLAQHNRNLNNFGSRIHKTENPAGVASAFTSFSRTPEFLRQLSRDVYEATGLSVPPEVWAHYVNGYFGGIGRMALQSAVLYEKISTGQDVQLRDYPALSTFVMARERYVETQFRKVIDAAEAANKVRVTAESGASQRADAEAMTEENARMVAIYKDIQKMRRHEAEAIRKAQAIKDPKDRNARLNEIESISRQYKADFVEAWMAAREASQ